MSRRRLARLVIIVMVLLILSGYVFVRAGVWLTVTDPLAPARAVVVLGGAMPFRAIEAAEVYHAGWASEVWVTNPMPTEEEVAAAKVGVRKIPEQDYSLEVLANLGVPAEHVRLIDRRVVNTADEMRSVASLSAPEDRIILITSKYHSRRVRTLWRRLIGEQPHAIIRYAATDPFDADRWWRNSHDGLMVIHEWFGLANVWLGFPVPSVRPE